MKYPIPREVLAQNVITLGKTGSGKSSALRCIVENMLAEKMPLCIIDPKGDWWGIKLSADGRHSGFPLVIFGGQHADVPINEHSGTHIAELFATGNRPCIIDLKGWMPAEMTRFFIDFASTLFRKNVGRRHLLIDEIHNFAPKGKVMDPAAGKSLHWANRIASEGRGLGITLIGASQRPQKVHNDLLTSCETLIAMRVIHKSDRTAYEDWVEGCGDKAKAKEMLSGVANLKRGTGYVWSPEIEFGPQIVEFPMFKTYDSFKPQEAGDADKLTGWATVDLDDVKEKLANVVKEAEANDPKVLNRTIAELRKELGKPKELAVDTAMLEEYREAGFVAGVDSARKAFFQHMQNLRGEFRNCIMEFEGKLSVTVEDIPIGDKIVKRQISPMPLGRDTEIEERVSVTKGTFVRKQDITLPPGEKAILVACAQNDQGCTKEQLTVLVGYKRSSRDTYIMKLNQKGFTAMVSGRVRATAAGIAALGDDYEPPLTGKALRDYWMRRLQPGESKIFSILCANYPDPISRDDISSATGYRRSSRDTYIQKLKSRQLLQTLPSSEVIASEILFA